MGNKEKSSAIGFTCGECHRVVTAKEVKKAFVCPYCKSGEEEEEEEDEE